MSITTLGVKRAVRVLTEAGIRAPKDTDLEAMALRWVDVIRGIDDSELGDAAKEYARRDNPGYAWPTTGQIVECARYLANSTDARCYTEPEDYDGPRATPEQVREAWAKYLDLDELKRLSDVRKARTTRGGQP
jgi:hypothetical protein